MNALRLTQLILRLLTVASGVAGLYFWFFSIYLWTEYATHDSSVPIPEAGRVYPLENHGSTVYITQAEHDTIYRNTYLGIGLLLLASALFLTRVVVKRHYAEKH